MRICNSKLWRLFFQVTVYCVCGVTSCSTIDAGLYLSALDPKEMREPLQYESAVKLFLEQMLAHPERYALSVYTRTAIKSNIKKSKKFTHAYYLVTATDGTEYTLSFNGTAFSPHSQGVWALNTNSDFGSYKSFVHGTNLWDVEKLVHDEINVRATVSNILKKLDQHNQYYYQDHLYNKPNFDNCITALNETLVTK